LLVETEDWGVGFEPDTVDESHFGLRGIRERARLFGGSATIDAVPGRGTRIAVELPMLESPPSAEGPSLD
jgi:signal transduction histidine kinase